jgi:hypothetical protein
MAHQNAETERTGSLQRVRPTFEPGTTNYYPNTTGTITQSGYTYKYRNLKLAGGIVLSDHVELYNATNSFLDVEWVYKDGAPLPLLPEDNTNTDFTDSSQSVRETIDMIKSCFSTYQKTLLRGKSMGITVRLDPSSGKIADVYFDFFRDSPFVNIPVETYRSVELALKQNLTITVTDEGRRLNYIELYWSQKF